jgi:ABC-type transport system substrate-binding protein
MDNSFDEFRLVHVGHGLVAALEFFSRQMIAAAKRWNRLGRVRRAILQNAQGHGLSPLGATGGFAQFQQVAEVVAGYWDAIGVRTSIVPTDLGAFRPLYMASPQSPQVVGQAGVFVTTGRLNGADDLRIWWTTAGKITQLANNVEEFAKKAAEGRTVEEIAQIVEKAYQVLYKDYRGIPIADVSGTLWAYGNQVVDVKVRPFRGYITPSLATATAGR